MRDCIARFGIPTFVALALLTGVGSLSAQAVRDPRQTATDLAGLAAKFSRFRVQLKSGQIVELSDPRLQLTTLVGRVHDGGTAEYPVDAVAQVWRPANHKRLGLRVGGLVGFVSGALGGWYAAGEDEESDEFDEAALAGLAGAAVLGTVGWALGSAIGRWKAAYNIRQGLVTASVAPWQIAIHINF